MGLFKRGNDDTVKYQMRQKMIAIGDDYWIEDSNGNKAYWVNGKAARMRDTWILEDATGREVAQIRERKLSVHDAIKIEIGRKEFVVKKAMIGIRERFIIESDGKKFKAHGNIVDHEYEIEDDGDRVAEISKKWFRVRDTYGVEIDGNVDPALILAITVAIDGFSRG